MKIRQGFVSNSSSSSFIVALPKEPKNREELQEMLFGKEDGALSIYDYEPVTFRAVACRVWNDIEDAKKKKSNKEDVWDRHPHKLGTLDAIADILAGRYYYQVDSCCYGAKTDGFGGTWYHEIGKDFFGTDEKALLALRDIYITLHKLTNKYMKERDAFEKAHYPPRVSWAAKDCKDRNDKPFTKEAIATYKKYCDECDKIRNGKKYIAMNNKRCKEEAPYKKEKDKLLDILGKADAKAFMEKNNGSFIFITDYADDNGDGDGDGTFEHGDIFHNVPHVVISNH